MSNNGDNASKDQLARECGADLVLDAALEGDDDAQCFLGMMWHKGHKNLPIDIEQAIRWYSMAAQNGRQDAEGILSSLTNEAKDLSSKTAHGAPKKKSPEFPKRKSFQERRADSSFTIRERGYKILGGLLPNRGSVGSDFEYRIDGNSLTRTGYDGRKTKYQTDGNLQVFFLKPGASEKYIFFAKFIDYYDKF